MNHNAFWESYKAKCSEKGLDAGTLEDFEKRQATPPTFSTDMLLGFGFKKSEPNAGTFKEVVPVKRGVGRPPKNKPRVEIFGDVPLLKERKEKMVSMCERVLHEMIMMAYKRGVLEGQERTSLIVDEEIPLVIDEVLGGKHVAQNKAFSR